MMSRNMFISLLTLFVFMGLLRPRGMVEACLVSGLLEGSQLGLRQLFEWPSWQLLTHLGYYALVVAVVFN